MAGTFILLIMVVYCSIITPPHRFVNRLRVHCMSYFHAFRFMQDKYSSILSRYPFSLVLVETDDHFTYYNNIGVELESYSRHIY